MRCDHPECTGVHDNNRYAELCPRSIDNKRARDRAYHSTIKGFLKRNRASMASRLVRYEAMFGEDDWLRDIRSGKRKAGSVRWYTRVVGKLKEAA